MNTSDELSSQNEENAPVADREDTASQATVVVPAAPPPPVLTAPPVAPPPPPLPATAPSSSGLEAMIPLKNPMALSSYYIGLFSLLPIIGLLMGIGAVVLGILGLKAARANPAIKGVTHAWVGIICGGFWALVYGTSLAFMVASAIWHF